MVGMRLRRIVTGLNEVLLLVIVVDRSVIVGVVSPIFVRCHRSSIVVFKCCCLVVTCIETEIIAD